MKKNSFLSIVMLSAAVMVGGTSMVSHAAPQSEVQVQTGKGYVIIGGQGMDSLRETLKKLEEKFGNGGVILPGPDAGTPEEGTELPQPDTPDAGLPTPELPGPEVSEPDQPDVETPEEETELPQPDTPDAGLPTPELPGPEVSEPDQPETETPDETPDADMTYAEKITELVNAERAKAGLPALTLNGKITDAANVRAKEIKQSFSHTRPNGSGFATALKEQNVSYRGAGENIAWGQRSPEEVMKGWMNSDGHRANILNKNFKNIGVGHYQDA